MEEKFNSERASSIPESTAYTEIDSIPEELQPIATLFSEAYTNEEMLLAIEELDSSIEASSHLRNHILGKYYKNVHPSAIMMDLAGQRKILLWTRTNLFCLLYKLRMKY